MALEEAFPRRRILEQSRVGRHFAYNASHLGLRVEEPGDWRPEAPLIGVHQLVYVPADYRHKGF